MVGTSLELALRGREGDLPGLPSAKGAVPRKASARVKMRNRHGQSELGKGRRGERETESDVESQRKGEDEG